MKQTTLIYLEKDNKYLMLHRVKKENDINKYKWIGVGGHFEKNESPEECAIREVREETGYEMQNYKLRAVITFIADDHEAEYMYLFTCSDFSGTPIECDEGTLEWVEKDKINELNIWEGDKIFLNKIAQNAPFFTLKLEYNGDTLVNSILKEY